MSHHVTQTWSSGKVLITTSHLSARTQADFVVIVCLVGVCLEQGHMSLRLVSNSLVEPKMTLNFFSARLYFLNARIMGLRTTTQFVWY